MQARTYELEPMKDVVAGRGLVIDVTDAGWAGWRYVHFADGTKSPSVTINEVWELRPSLIEAFAELLRYFETADVAMMPFTRGRGKQRANADDVRAHAADKLRAFGDEHGLWGGKVA